MAAKKPAKGAARKATGAAKKATGSAKKPAVKTNAKPVAAKPVAVKKTKPVSVAKRGTVTKSGAVAKSGTVAKRGTVTKSGAVAKRGAVVKRGTVTKSGAVVKSGAVTKSGAVARKAPTKTKAAAAKPTRTGLKPAPPERHARTKAPAAIAKAMKTSGRTPARDAAPTAAPAAKAAAPPPRRRPMRPARDIYSPATGTNSSDPVLGKELEKFRQLIVDLRNESIEELEMLTEQLREMTASEVGEDNNAYSLHMAEQGTDAMEREKTFLQAQRTSDYVKKLGEALERIGNGTFGLCRVCGLRLDSKRLMAVPVTQVCTVYKNTSKPCEPGRLHMQELGITEEESAG